MVECNRESCVFNGIIINGKVYLRDTTYFDRGLHCHDCRIVNKKGNIHHYGCDIERCPRCSNQLISCYCKKERLIEVEMKSSDKTADISNM